jgi:hypothetical protein
MTSCIDLRKRFGDRWRVGRDPSALPKTRDLLELEVARQAPWGGELPVGATLEYPTYVHLRFPSLKCFQFDSRVA